MLILTACSSAISTAEIWEGIRGNTLRVFVTIDAAQEGVTGDRKKELQEALLAAGRNRATLLLLSYARLHVTAAERLEACRRIIPEIVEKEATRFSTCSEQGCTAVFDFDAEKFLVAAENREPERQ